MNNIRNLSNIFIKDNNYYLKIFKDDKNTNKKSLMFWVITVLIFAISYLSYEIIKYLIKIEQPEIFINSYFLFLEILIIIQTITLCTNVFYFSKDIENILPLPFKPIEILISKFNTILSMLYSTELLFGVIPLVIYGILIKSGIFFYIKLILGLIIFPIFPAMIITIIMMFLMQIIKIFRNKDLMQFIISFILIILLMFFMFFSFKNIINNIQDINEGEIQNFLNNINLNIKKINNYFLTINPIINIILKNNIFIFLKNIFKLLFINFIGILLFIFLGNKLYLKQLLKSKFYSKIKKEENINLNKNCKKNKIKNTFIKKEFKLLFKNPSFFLQCIYPVLLFLISVTILLVVLIIRFNNLLQLEEYRELAKEITFDIEIVCLVVGLTQIVGLFNYSSITAFSREGKDAYIIKYLPVNFYKQYIYKNIPQIFINNIISIILIGIIFYSFNKIPRIYFLPVIIISFLFNMFNSFILTFIDLIMPKLKWDSEYEILKNNKNKLIQYVLIIFNIIFLIYIKNVLKGLEINLIYILFIFISILLILNILINLFIKINEKKLFKKIN